MIKKPLNVVLFGTIILVSVLGLQASSHAQIQSLEVSSEESSLSIMQDLPPQPSFISNDDEVDLIVDQLSVDEEVINIPSDTIVMPDDELQPGQESAVNAVGEVQEQNSGPVAVPPSGTYFDYSSIGGGATTNSLAPREVDPRYEPGSSYVVVQTTSGANSVPARMVAAQRALNLGRYSAALELYEKLYSDSPKNRHVLMGLAVAQQQNGFTESAIATYEELLNHEPNNAGAMINMLGLIKTQYPSVALRRLLSLWEKNSNNPHIASEIALISASQGQYQEALRYIGVAASLEPNNPSHFYNMAVIYDRAGQTKEAIEFYQKALEVDISYSEKGNISRDEVYDRLASLRRL